MAAAIRLYGRDGFRNVSVKSLCAAAGLTERYLYESFENNEDLLRQCFAEVNGKLIAELRAAAFGTSGDVRGRLRVAILVYLDRLRADLPAARLFLIEMANVSPKAEALFLRSLDEFGALLVDVLDAGRTGPGRYPPLLLRGVIGGGFHVARAWISGGCSENVEEVADAFLDLYASLIRRDPDPVGRVGTARSRD